jgi:hypothetical protein
MRSTVIGGLAIASALAVTGCGGARSISKTDLIRRGDARCAQDNRRISAIPQPPFGPQSTTRAQLPQAAGYLAKVNPIHRSQIAYLHRLGQPTEGGEQWQQILAQADQAGAALRDAERFARAGDLRRFKLQFTRLERNRYPQLARKFGFTQCGQG